VKLIELVTIGPISFCIMDDAALFMCGY